MRVKRFRQKFVHSIPPYDQMEDGVLYISTFCNVAVHKCACGCGQEVVTTIAPNRWKMTYDGKTVTLAPSIGNWYFDCRSHYFIKENRVVWAEKLSDVETRKPRKFCFRRLWNWVGLGCLKRDESKSSGYRCPFDLR